MRPLIVALVAGLMVTALPVGPGSTADAQVAVVAPAATTVAPGYPAGTYSWRYKFYNG
jgi:hypothetical protein